MDLWVNMKFMKASPLVARADSRPAVTLLDTDQRVFMMPCSVHSVDNPRETLLALCVPQRERLALTFKLHHPVRRVLVGKCDQPFQCIGDEITVYLTTGDQDCLTGAEVIGYITQPGLQLYVNLPDPLRAAGAYAGGLPEEATRVTLAMEFALRKAALALGLDRTVGLSKLGPLNIMGFDTNNPHGHTDAPPHVHIHPAGTRYGAPIPHYYYGDDGRLDRNKVGWRKVKGSERFLGRGETFEHRAPGGTLLYATQITNEGGLKITAPSGEHAIATPIGKGNPEVQLDLNGALHVFTTRMCFDTGILSVSEDGALTQYKFDIDTGRYLGPVEAQALTTDTAKALS